MLVCGNHRVSVKYQNDPDKILEMANKKPAYPPFGRDEVNVLNTCVNAGLEMEEGQRNYSVKRKANRRRNRCSWRSIWRIPQQGMRSLKIWQGCMRGCQK